METILLLIRLFLFGVFALAGIGKLLDRKGSEKAVRDFGVPAGVAGPTAFILPIVELVIAIGLLFTGSSWMAAIGALLLLLIFIGGMLYQMAQGNAPDCHCFGQLHSEPVSKSSLLRNIGFALLALFLSVQGNDNQGLSLAQDGSGIVQSLLIIAVLLALTAALFYLRLIIDQQTKLMRRIEMLELIGGGGTAQERDDAGNPEDALPMGAPFPDFDLPNASGRSVKFEHIIAEGKPSLFFLLGPNCSPCKALYPDIDRWSNELADRVKTVIVSSGDAADNMDRFPGELGKQILLQKNREVAESLHSKWTPTAFFVDADGDIASHPAVGDSAIRELVDRVSAANLEEPYTHFASSAIKRPTKIGKPIPDTTLELLDGGKLATASLIGKETLVVFWSLTCPHCIEMLDELKAYENTRGENEPELLIFTEADPEALRETGLRSRIVLDPKYSASVEFGMFGTPSGVIVDRNGVIATEIAIGSSNIWALLGRKP